MSISKSRFQTKKTGEKLARKMLRSRSRGTAFVIGLNGELGSGKTTFLQGFAKSLGLEEKITSPTFVIMRKFQIPASKFKTLYHLDCYRVQNAKEILDLGWRKIIKNPKNIVAVEWAEKIKKIMPEDALWLYFKFLSRNKRRIVLK